MSKTYRKPRSGAFGRLTMKRYAPVVQDRDLCRLQPRSARISRDGETVKMDWEDMRGTGYSVGKCLRLTERRVIETQLAEMAPLFEVEIVSMSKEGRLDTESDLLYDDWMDEEAFRMDLDMLEEKWERDNEEAFYDATYYDYMDW